MKRKVERIAKELAGRLSEWEITDTIALSESAATEIYDPYFFLSLDLYYRGEIPDAVTRNKLFADAGAFESSPFNKKDRCFIEGLPVRVEYKDIERIDRILSGEQGESWSYRPPGTYMFYRIERGNILFQRSDWIDKTRENLKNLSDSFWGFISQTTQNAMEHYLEDLSAAVVQNDKFFFLVSSSGFIKSICSLLFIINRSFEPSTRRFYEAVKELSQLPDNFRGRFESFLRNDEEFSPARKREVAELLAKSVIAMA